MDDFTTKNRDFLHGDQREGVDPLTMGAIGAAINLVGQLFGKSPDQMSKDEMAMLQAEQRRQEEAKKQQNLMIGGGLLVVVIAVVVVMKKKK